MFKVKRFANTSYYVNRGGRENLHSDGQILQTREYWPTEAQAQAVLDKFQPPHVWVHGDVFKAASNCGLDHPMMYVTTGGYGPYVIHLTNYQVRSRCLENYLENATFLFNIRSKIEVSP